MVFSCTDRLLRSACFVLFCFCCFFVLFCLFVFCCFFFLLFFILVLLVTFELDKLFSGYLFKVRQGKSISEIKRKRDNFEKKIRWATPMRQCFLQQRDYWVEILFNRHYWVEILFNRHYLEEWDSDRSKHYNQTGDTIVLKISQIHT